MPNDDYINSNADAPFNRPGLPDLEFIAAIRDARDVPVSLRLEAAQARLPYVEPQAHKPTVFALGDQDVTISVKIPAFFDGFGGHA
jgi:hypothetical protein